MSLFPHVLFDRSTGEQVAKLMVPPLVRGTVLHLMQTDADTLPNVYKSGVWRVVGDPEIAIAAGYRASAAKLLVEEIGNFIPPDRGAVFDWIMNFSEVAPPDRREDPVE